MDVEKVKGYIENSTTIEGDGLPFRFFESLIMHGLSVDLIETGRVVCSFKVSPRLLNGENSLHGGVTVTLVDLVSSAAIYTVGAPFPGSSVEINVSFLDAAYADEEIEIEARALRVGKAVAVLSAELRKKNTGKIIAQGRHTKYLPLPSKM
ncbi:acyl-coenzyme A thioesterase 13-like [Durio zibethinus]|uniref:Acyl-coenzyme A thioesterase 13 n=1 Tax=Durio zibethinus TaxID=66656 RepID=A0A6P5ZDC7_DURZI|nr:acyl-coenzyme A thioesterase 13-like [Durio zibethinus]